MIIKRIATGPEGSDCTAPYEIRFNTELTVKQFIDTILKEYPDEWGSIVIDNGLVHVKQIYDDKSCEYSHGKITYYDITPEIENSIVKSAISRGGWTAMDYVLRLQEAIVCTTYGTPGTAAIK